MLVVLDEGDLLNPDETIKRYQMGVDTKFLVEHFGGGDLEEE